MPLVVEIVTAERIVRTEEGVEVLIAPGSEGQLAILSRHAPLMTTLDSGELVFRRGSEESAFAVTGGFLEVHSDHVTVLANAAESADEIDVDRAEEARRRAEDRLRGVQQEVDVMEVDLRRAQAALRRAMVRLRVAENRRRRPAAMPGAST